VVCEHIFCYFITVATANKSKPFGRNTTSTEALITNRYYKESNDRGDSILDERGNLETDTKK
jgi:hypothetical protein